MVRGRQHDGFYASTGGQHQQRWFAYVIPVCVVHRTLPHHKPNLPEVIKAVIRTRPLFHISAGSREMTGGCRKDGTKRMHDARLVKE
jgi:hypothetical protein